MSTRLGVPGWGYPAGGTRLAPRQTANLNMNKHPVERRGVFWCGWGREAVEAGRVGKPSRRGACQRLTARTNVPLSLWVRPLSLWVRPLSLWVRPLSLWVRRHGDKTSAVCDESIVLFNPLFNPLFNLALNCCVREAAKKAKATHGI